MSLLHHGSKRGLGAKVPLLRGTTLMVVSIVELSTLLAAALAPDLGRRPLVGTTVGDQGT